MRFRQGIGQASRVSAGSLTYTASQLGINAETGTVGTWFTTAPDGTNLGERQSGNHYYFLFDGLGSVTAVTNSSGTVIKTYKYDPYGNTTVASGTLYEPITYAGGYYDTQSSGSGPKLIKFGERYYDPTIGRWTTIDPADNPLDQHGWNQYDYAGDDPINMTDPSGLCGAYYHWACHPIRWAKLQYGYVRGSMDYSNYWFAYEIRHHTNWFGSGFNEWLLDHERAGLRGDERWDIYEHRLGDKRGFCDENQTFAGFIHLYGCHAPGTSNAGAVDW